MANAEEQQMEMEALEAILGEGILLEYEGMVPDGWDASAAVYKVKVAPEGNDEATTASLDVLFQHTPAYPQEPPRLKVSNTRGMTGEDVSALQKVLDAAALGSIGMPCIYDVLQAAQEWLESKSGLEQEMDPEALRKAEEEAAERARAEARAHGTPVTKASFAEWRERFEAAQATSAQECPAVVAVATDSADRVTGKQWFLEKDRPDIGDPDADLDAEAEEDAEEEGEGGKTYGSSSDDGSLGEADSDEDAFLDDFLAAAGEPP